MYEHSEWDHRAPTIAEALDAAQRDWEGARCRHGFALLPFGPDVWCGACEQEEHDEVARRMECERHDEQGRWSWPLGPHRSEVGMREQGEPPLLGDDEELWF